MAFRSLREMEIELVAMTSSLFFGDVPCDEESQLRDELQREFLKKDMVGNMTSGGTESLLLMMKTYRDYFTNNYDSFIQSMKRKYNKVNDDKSQPFEVIVPSTIHPAVNKGAHYFGLKLVEVPVDPFTMAVTPEAVQKAFNPGRTILIIASAPSYPHGVMDPIEKLAQLAVKLGPVGLHVDSCIGGYVIPFVDRLNKQSPNEEQLDPFDFRLLGVTSLSADLHKYGYGCKGASVLLFRNESIRENQFFVYGGWSGGLYVSPAILGSKGGGPIASSYASVKLLGIEGFMNVTEKMVRVRKTIQNAIETDPVLSRYLTIVGKPCSTIMSFTTKQALREYYESKSVQYTKGRVETLSIFAISDRMEKKYGWDLQRQMKPDCLHMTLMPQHIGLENQIISDLIESVNYVKDHPDEFAGKNSVAMYGMVANVSNWLSEDVVELFLTIFVGEVYRLR